MLKSQLTTTEYAEYYQPYISLVTEENALDAQEAQISTLRDMVDPLDEITADTIHEPFGWTIKQVVDHLINNEKIFGYRALRFSVGDTQDLLGYDQDKFAANANIQNCSMRTLTDEFEFARRSNLLMFRRLADDAWDQKGKTDGNLISVRAIAFLQVGHARHHLNIVQRRLSR